MTRKELEREKISLRFNSTKDSLNERSRRLFAAAEAKAYGYGGIVLVKESTGMSSKTIHKGLKELELYNCLSSKLDRIRKKGGGRKKLTDKDSTLKSDLEKIVSPHTVGDPEKVLQWTSKSLRKITEELKKLSHVVSFKTVGMLLKELGYSLQSNRKVKEGLNHPDRDEQFNFINNKVKKFQSENQPIISVDTKKKELVGDFKNAGQEYAEKGNPVKVNVHDFLSSGEGKAAPYGIYDITSNEGMVNVGISSDTAEFAVNSIRIWYSKICKARYPTATKLYINADGGGSNGSRVRLWKTELQKLANELNIEIHVSHFPPATSKWNKIEHKMFCFISKNWRGRPLASFATIINLISNTKTTTGLKIDAYLDMKHYETGIKISDKELSQINLTKNEFHGEWNYIISPLIV
jgi:hypothetical protein